MTATENSNHHEAHMPSSSENTEGQTLPSTAFLLMGKTGVGKSSFIKLLGGKNVDTGDEPDVSSSTKSCTLKLAQYQFTLCGKRIILIDTPGFDDSTRDNIELLHDIVSYLWYLSRNKEQFPLHGIIFLHDIGETRFTGSQQKTLSILRDICGERCMRNVIIGTTMWNEDRPKKFEIQQKREDEMMKEYWNGIHSTTRLFEDDSDAAVSIITTLLLMPPVLLLVQEEMLRPPHAIGETTVGKKIIETGIEEQERLQKIGKTEEAGAFETLLKTLKNPADMTFAQKFGLAIAAPIVLAPAAFIAAPVGVIYALVHAVDALASRGK